MNKQYFNIAIAGLSLNHSEALKVQLRNLIPEHYKIQWTNATDPSIDCLFIHEYFYDTDGIQKILHKKKCPWLKIAKKANTEIQIENNTLYLPVTEQKALFDWINYHLIQSAQSPTEPEMQINPIQYAQLDEDFFKLFFDEENHSKLHLYDTTGTLAVICPKQNIAWLNQEHNQHRTDATFNYDLAKISDITQVSRKNTHILQDWLWNLFWYSNDTIKNLAPEDGHYKIHFWPKPTDQANRKIIFQLSACFIQGGKISQIAEQLDIAAPLVRHFIATNMAANNIEKINPWDKHYTPPVQAIKQQEQSVVKSFLGKIRQKFGF